MCLTPRFPYLEDGDIGMPPPDNACWLWERLASRPFLTVSNETACVLLSAARAFFCAPP
jgi:hypothetical protein